MNHLDTPCRQAGSMHRLITPAVLALSLVACDKKVDPSGAYQGSVHAGMTKLSSREIVLGGANHEPVSVERLDDGRFKVHFGECWAIVTRPKEKMDVKWEFQEGNTCTSGKAGEVTISEGYLQTWDLDGEQISFGFGGLNADSTLKVDFNLPPSHRK